jgi:hypothetical protein
MHTTCTSRRKRRTWLWPSLMAVAAMAVAPATASAGLTLLKPNPTDPATYVGNGGYSADGLGQNGTGGTVQADVPAGSTVEQAYLYGTYFTLDPSLSDRQIDFDGTVVTLTKISDVGGSLSTARADVTAQVAAKVGSGGSVTDFAVNTDPPSLDGIGLVVIYSNPASPETTVAVLDGSASQAGDSATFNFAAPLDKTVPGFSAIMSLGSGFSFQGESAPSHACGEQAGQSSIVDVNATRLTSCAGNFDDGYAANGGLITVGGVGDSVNNPADANQQPADGALPRVEDDELYDLDSFLTQGDSAVTINSSNPSSDDNLFLAVISITARATVSQENCTNGIDDDGDGLADAADPDCAPPPTEVCDNGIDDDGDNLVDRADPDCPALPDGRWMTGGGTVKTGNAKTLSHGFALPCDASGPGNPAKLQVNWDQSKFHLTELDSTSCSDDPAISEGKPVAGFDTHTGSGTGRYNGADGATAEWTIKDAGEPGRKDTIRITITDADGNVVLDKSDTLAVGNHQAHPDS